MTTRWQVPRDWVGETVAVLASGPSMSQEVADYVRGKCRVIAISNVGIDTEDDDNQLIPALAPWADVLYAADGKWWNYYRSRALQFPKDKVMIRHAVPYKEILSLEQSKNNGPYDERPSYMVHGGCSGYQGIHLAAQRGAKRILLCGFDMKPGKKLDKKGKPIKHYFGSHKSNLNTLMRFQVWITNLGLLAPELKKRQISVYNCTPDSALNCFQRSELTKVLK